MKPRSLAVLGAAAALTVAAPAAAAKPKSGASGPNQGEASKVLTVDNEAVSCATPVALAKVEGGGLGRTIAVSADQPVDKVTVKSGVGAVVVSASFADANSAVITLSKDVSNYVVWVCPGGSGGGGGGGGEIPT